MGKIYIFFFLLFSLQNINYSQNNDTIYVTNNVNRPIEFSKSKGKYLFVKDIIPNDVTEKLRKILIISSIGTKINTKDIQAIDNKHLLIPIDLFTERYYTIYIYKGKATLLSKKLIIK